MVNKKSKKSNDTRREHWLPRASYLAHFLNENGKVIVYFFKANDRAHFYKTAEKKEITPENVGLENGLYETPALPPNTIEKALSKIEASYGKILDSKIKRREALTEKEHEIVAQYVSTLENRTPMQRDHVNSFINRLSETGQAISMGHNAPEAAADWAKKMEKAKEAIFAQWMVTTIEMNKWSALDFCFLVPASYVHEKYISSDHPVTLVDMTSDNSPYGLNQWHETAECVVALTPEIALFGNTRGITGYQEVDYNFVREINNRVLRRANKMIIASAPITEDEGSAIVDRMPQSLLLKFVKLPHNGRSDKIIRKQTRREKREALISHLVDYLGRIKRKT